MKILWALQNHAELLSEEQPLGIWKQQGFRWGAIHECAILQRDDWIVRTSSLGQSTVEINELLNRVLDMCAITP